MIHTLSTETVTLVAADRRWISTSIVRPDKLAAHLRVALAHDWDNRTYNEDGFWVLRLMNEGDEGWWLWWIIERPTQDRPRPALVGFTGFKGPPSPGGNVELLYNVAPSCRRRGLASQSTRLLVNWAFRNPKVRRAILTIDPANAASCAVARSCGFSRRENECDEWMLVFALERGQLRGAGRPCGVPALGDGARP